MQTWLHFLLSDNAREIIIDSPPRANVLGTPNQSRNKFTIPTRETVTNLQGILIKAFFIIDKYFVDTLEL